MITTSTLALINNYLIVIAKYLYDSILNVFTYPCIVSIYIALHHSNSNANQITMERNGHWNMVRMQIQIPLSNNVYVNIHIGYDHLKSN